MKKMVKQMSNMQQKGKKNMKMPGMDSFFK